MIPLSEIKPGHWLGRYQVVDTLGWHRGHWCYAARALAAGHAPHREDGLVLVKCPDEQRRDDLGWRKLRFDEAGIGSLVRHPNVARLYESGHDRDRCQLVMELVRGEPLSRLIEQRPLSIEATLAAGRQISVALHYVHELCTHEGEALHLVHRNLSPEAVIVGGDGFIKLVDFDYMWPAGFGRMLDDARDRIYFSPEQCRGLPIDRRADIFNAGAVLYEASTGRYPFDGDSTFDLLEGIAFGAVTPPSLHVEGYPYALERVIMTALSREPERRQQTAQELRVDLELAAEELGLECTGHPRLPLAAHLASLEGPAE
jgi:serine/threonine-protein kinase